MSRQFKAGALLTFMLAILFYLFFEISKHNPALSQVNAFGDDPYDSVGSFGVQIALFTAFLSLIRAFRPYQPGKALDNQELLLLRGEYFSCLSVVVTLIADIVALIRHPAIWIGAEPAGSAGYTLAALVGGLFLLAVLVIWLLHNTARDRRLLSAQKTWARAIGLSIVSIILLALYPESLRTSVPGEIFTILFGIAFLMVLVWAIGTTVSPYPGALLGTFFEDLIDDLAAVYRSLKAHIGPLAVFCTLLENILGWSLLRAVLDWLNPREHTWNLAIVLGIVAGIMLTLAETLGEGGSSQQVGRFALLATLFVSLECIGVLLGYSVFAKPLGLFRHTRPRSGAAA